MHDFNIKNITYHSTIKTKPASVKDNAYTDFDKKANDKDRESKVCDYVKIFKM